VVSAVTLQEIDDRWLDIKHALKGENPQTEALLNSSIEHWIEDGNRLVLNFAGDFLADRMAADSNRLLVEKVLGAVLGKSCRMRSAVRERIPLRTSEDIEEPNTLGAGSVPQDSVTESMNASAGAESDLQEESDPLQDVSNDSVIQELLSRGGEVTDVQILAEDK
jgi:hypothetical protein